MTDRQRNAPGSIRPEGHDLLLDRLAESAARGRDADRIGHAYLFSGPAGVGKFATALWWARRLKCERPEACEANCPPCRQISAGSNPDMVVLEPPEPGKAIRIERIRDDLLPALSRRGLQTGPKIAIVRDAHLLTPEAQSATLKLLEEPPGYSVIILVTERPAAMYSTIRSRCQTVRFGRVEVDIVVRLLIAAGRSEETARRASEIARGSVGLAFEYTEERLADRDELIRGYQSVRVGGDLEGFVGELVERRKEARDGLEALMSWEIDRLETTLDYAAGGESGTLTTTSRDEIDGIVKRADRIRATLAALERNVNAKMAIRDLLLDARET